MTFIVENNRMTWVGLSQPFLFIYVWQNTTVTVGITTLESSYINFLFRDIHAIHSIICPLKLRVEDRPEA